jgi:hypothetical protein
MVHRGKKAQDGTKAATLVAIIGGLIILYILFIPPSQRQQLLNITNETTEEENVTGGAVSNQTLLLEHPGLLEYISSTEYEKSIPPLTLMVSTEATTLRTAEAIAIKNNWFTSDYYNLSFSLGDVKNTQNVIFSFNIDSKEGELILELNGQTIYQREPSEQNLAVRLPADILRGQNSLIIKAGSVGFAFWKTNRYALSNLNLVADITDVSRKKSQSSFIISSTENNNLESASLRFYVDCAGKAEIGKLNVDINNHNVYSQVPVCGDMVSQAISPNTLTSGENAITFSTEFEKPTTAYYNIDNILIKLKLKSTLPSTYYFDLNSTQLNAVRNGTRNLEVYMLFTDSVASKKADIYVNGLKTGLDTRSYNYTRNINSFAKEGNNAIKIIPLSTFEIVDLIARIV